MSTERVLSPTLHRNLKRALILLWCVASASLFLSAIGLTVFGDRVSLSLRGDQMLLTMGIVALLSFVAEYVDSSLGMGYGTTLTPMLLLLGFSPLQVVPAVLVQELISGSLAAAGHHSLGNADLRFRGRALRLGVLLGLCGVLGAVMAATVAVRLPATTIKAITGAIVIAMGVLVVGSGHLRLQFSTWRAGTLGLVASINKGFMGGGYGPLMTAGQVVIGIGAREAVAITSLSEALTCVGGIAGYVTGGAAICWPLAGAMVVGGAVAALLAAATVRAVSADKLKVAVAAGCFVLGSLTLLRVVLK